MMRRAAMALAAMVFTTGAAFAQSTVSSSLSTSTVSQTQQTTAQTQTDSMQQADPMPQSMMTMEADRRPATTTVDGDTGLWFVPTAEVLGPRKWFERSSLCLLFPKSTPSLCLRLRWPRRRTQPECRRG